MCTPIGLMLQEKAAKVSEIIALRGAVPRGLLQVGVMVDDLVVLEQALKTGFGEDGTYYGTWDSAERMIRVHAACRKVGLKKKPKKSVHCRPWHSGCCKLTCRFCRLRVSY